jgi:tetratricopeptide (TPR) repeat protein
MAPSGRKKKPIQKIKVTQTVTLKPKAKIFYLVVLLFPILFFILLELGLRLFDYGNDYTQWVNPAKGLYVLNPGIAHKYFHNIDNVPYSNQDVFDEIKKPNSFRVFVLGESSGAGYPYVPIGAFSRYLQQRLSLEYPDSKIEVINCSMTAINTYTMRDLFPGILEQKPDLILIYAGHNEYYGALGVGSIESLGTSRSIVNMVIYLENFKTFQLVRNLLKGAVGLFSNKQPLTGTLMSRMAQNQYIALNSNIYKKGIDQFSGNMRDILDMAKKKNVPVILGTLACNLKDQYPFVSVKQNGLPPADNVFSRAKELLEKNNLKEADSLFRYAKDLDALRFRAPSEINKIITEFGEKYNYPVVNIDSVFNSISPYQITGDNLMIDHLHPTLRGYQVIGNLFYNEMSKLNLLPKTKPQSFNSRQQDSITIANYPFARLDTVISDYRIRILKNDWPYIKIENKIPENKLFHLRDYIDTLAYNLTTDRITWEAAHRKAAEWYLKRNDTKSFTSIMDVLISQYPFIMGYYDYTIADLLANKEYDKAYSYLIKRNETESNAYSTKWLGIINLFRNHLDAAEKFLNQSLTLENSDAQVWYNLAGVYVNKHNYIKALDMVNKAISLQSNYTDALILKGNLQRAMK